MLTSDFLQVSADSAKVLDWFIGVATATQLVTWLAMSVTYLCWRRAMKAQGFSRDTLVYRSRWLPYGTYFAIFGAFVVTLTNGYDVFLNGGWDVASFLFAYGSPIFFAAVFIIRKAIHRTPFVKPAEADLWSGLEEIEEHEASLVQDIEVAGKRSKWDVAKSWLL